MHDEIMNFIGKFQNEGTIKTFTEGCCYWFAEILRRRFPGLIMYNPIDNHFAFATSTDARLYDITGELEKTKDWSIWEEYKRRDNLETERIYRYCINKTD